MLNQYETVFIMTPVLSEDQMKETVKKFENILLEKGAEIIHQENWGLRRLEYPIDKKTSGFYHLIQFAAEGSIVKDFELQYRRDEKIMRYLTVALDKHAIAYSEKRRSLRKDVKAPQVVVEPVITHVPEVVILPAEVDVNTIDELINE
jgi:small subunit ribosomal protein S6